MNTELIYTRVAAATQHKSGCWWHLVWHAVCLFNNVPRSSRLYNCRIRHTIRFARLEYSAGCLESTGYMCVAEHLPFTNTHARPKGWWVVVVVGGWVPAITLSHMYIVHADVFNTRQYQRHTLSPGVNSVLFNLYQFVRSNYVLNVLPYPNQPSLTNHSVSHLCMADLKHMVAYETSLRAMMVNAHKYVRFFGHH